MSRSGVTVRENPRLPRLGWVARVPSTGLVAIEHGSSVERGDDFVVEGIWDGAFGPSFGGAPHFFGSGVRVAGGTVTLVPSCALVDRVVWARDRHQLVASNSLALLLGALGWRLTPEENYLRALYAITRGISTYDDRICTTGGTVHQLFYRNMEIGSDLEPRLAYKAEPREIRSFEDYASLLRTAVRSLGANMADARRRMRVEPIATISRGYDSPAVCALARDLGLRTCYTARRSNSMIPAVVSRAATDDDGTCVARALGLDARVLRRTIENELHFLAGSDEPELVFGGLAAEIGRSGTVAAVFTGYHGDMVWRADAFDDDRAPEVIRHDISGLNLGEIRLEAGFFNVPLTFLHVRSLASIGRISRSPDMFPWRTWNEYDRPIPRRLLMEAGVDGRLFGQRKKAVVDRPHWPAAPALRADFLATVRAETGYAPGIVAASRALEGLLAVPAAALKRAGIRLPAVVRPSDLRSRMYVWAVNRLADRYAPAVESIREPSSAAAGVLVQADPVRER